MTACVAAGDQCQQLVARLRRGSGDDGVEQDVRVLLAAHRTVDDERLDLGMHRHVDQSVPGGIDPGFGERDAELGAGTGLAVGKRLDDDLCAAFELARA